MTITYANHKEFENLKYGEHNGKTLVFGFMVSTEDGKGNAAEQRYAVHKDGRIKATPVEPWATTYFNKPGLVWTDVTSVPDHAEWIGQYVDDMF